MILAGYPKDMVETYKQQGINLFIHVKADVVSVLSQLAELMEVAK
jgi:methylmalonyl-CoA mutase